MLSNSRLIIEEEGLSLSPQQEERTQEQLLEKKAWLLKYRGEKCLADFSTQSLVRLGLAYNEQNNYLEGGQAFQLALEKLFSDDFNIAEKNFIFATCYFGLAHIAREEGEDNNAIRLFTVAHSHLEQSLAAKLEPLDSPLALLAYQLEKNCGIAYLKIKQFQTAAACFKKAHALAQQTQLPQLIAPALSYYGLALILNFDEEAGFAALNSARLLYPIETREGSLDWASHRYHYGCGNQANGQFIQAICEYKEALRLREQNLKEEGTLYFHSRMGNIQLGLGESYYQLKNFINAEKWLRRAFKHFKEIHYETKMNEINQLLQNLSAVQAAAQTGNHAAEASEKTRQHKQVLQYGLSAALVLGTGFFACRNLWGSKAAATPELAKASFTPQI